MAGGPLTPDTVTPSSGIAAMVYVPAVNTSLAGDFAAYAVPCGSLSNQTLALEFNMPEVIPTGTPKLRLLAEANATVGVVNLQVADVAVAATSNLGSATLTSDTGPTVTFTAADTLVDTKVALSAVPTANQILLVLVTFLTTSTLAQKSAWQPTLVWE